MCWIRHKEVLRNTCVVDKRSWGDFSYLVDNLLLRDFLILRLVE